jgi:undecaprenyl-diphosphatase
MLQSADEQLAWLIILATIPVGLAGLALEHVFRVVFGKPVYAAVFLIINGLILLAGERFRSRASLRADRQIAASRERGRATAYAARAGHAAGRRDIGEGTVWDGEGRAAWEGEDPDYAAESDRRLAVMGPVRAVVIGSAQVAALAAGISRDGVTMVAGMARGLSREDAARFAFLLATPVILAAGALKIPDLMGPLGNGIHGQVLVGSVLSGVGAYLSVRWLTRYFQTRTLTPFGIYCIAAGLASIAYLQLVK